MSGPGNAAAAAAGAPLPAMGGVVAPQFPYDPDPGSITGWILADSADVDDAEMVRSYQANIQRYADLPHQGAVFSRMRKDAKEFSALDCRISLTTDRLFLKNFRITHASNQLLHAQIDRIATRKSKVKTHWECSASRRRS